MPNFTTQEAEEKIMSIWAEVLGEEDIQAEDDFFDLGGSSIAAIRLLPQLASAFAIEPEIGLLFDNPTPRELAAAVLENHLR